MGVRNTPPHAGAMFESLRGLGYSPSTALADLIDNSIAAQATEVDVLFEWQGPQSWIRIVDNGVGMDDSTLESGMRLGAADPRAKRAATDLGRFGLGLKTASFSQARRLTVASRRKGGPIVCLRWDLNLLDLPEADAAWPLFEGAAPGSEALLAPLDTMEQGTIVLWEDLDRVVTEGFASADMIELIGVVEAHLAMTFHRLLDGEGAPFRLRLNGEAVRSWDPFLTGNAAKAWESAEYRLLNSPDTFVQCHVLPHRDMLKSLEQDNAGGPGGWTQQQGFYVYRNKRLLMAGGWLGLGDNGRSWVRDEPHRLARMRLDIPNSVDADWKINVLKSTASPPVRLRDQLRRLAVETRGTARKVFAHRGHISSASGGRADGVKDAWQVRRSANGTSYRIARDNDLVASILERAGPLSSDIVAMFRLIEETVPVQRIWLDTAEDKETPRTGFSGVPSEQIKETLVAMFAALVRHSNLNEEEARQRLRRSTGFERFPELISSLSLTDIA